MRSLGSVVFVLLLSIAAGCAPSIGTVDPNPATPGATVTIQGANFGSDGDGNTFSVTYDNAPMNVVSRTATQIVAKCLWSGSERIVRIACWQLGICMASIKSSRSAVDGLPRFAPFPGP